jgi:hypothetical protein
LPVAITECSKHIILGGKIKVEGALGDVGRGGDLLDGGGCHALLKKQLLGGVHQVIAPLSRGLCSWTRFGFGGHWDRRASVTERWSVTVG